jgi:hypothetical protein
MSDETRAEFKKDLEQLRDAYSETLAVYHRCRHFTAMKSINIVLNELNYAIKMLEDAIKEPKP